MRESCREHRSEHRLQDRADLGVRTHLRGNDSQSFDGTGEPGEVAVDHGGVKQIEQKRAPLLVHLAHDSEVEECHSAVVEDPHVARMHVAVEEAVQHKGFHPDLGGAADDELGLLSWLVAVEWGAVHAFHADDAPTAVVEKHLGGGDVGVVVERADGRAKAVLALGFHGAVEFGEGGSVQVDDDRRRVGRGEERNELLESAGDEVRDAQVDLHAVVDASPLYLHDHFTAVVAANAQMHLSDRGGRERYVVERGEQVVDSATQIGLDHRARLRTGERWHLVEAAQTGIGENLGKQSGRGAHQLTDLDEGGSEYEEGVDDGLRGVQWPPAPWRAHPTADRDELEVRQHRSDDDEPQQFSYSESLQLGCGLRCHGLGCHGLGGHTCTPAGTRAAEASRRASSRSNRVASSEARESTNAP